MFVRGFVYLFVFLLNDHGLQPRLCQSDVILRGKIIYSSSEATCFDDGKADKQLPVVPHVTTMCQSEHVYP